MALQGRAKADLAGCLGSCIDAERVCGVAFTIGSALSSVEYEVRGDMNHHGTYVPTGERQRLDGCVVYGSAGFGVTLGTIDVGVSRGIDDDVRSGLTQPLPHGPGITDV